MKRWYDSHPIGKYLDHFKGMQKKQRDPYILGIMKIAKKYGSSFIDDSVMDFPLELIRRRWYDMDPNLWIVFNGLERADVKLLDEISVYLEENLKPADENPDTSNHPHRIIQPHYRY
jgi:hypothetical protein